jgi:putative transposase
MCPLLGVTSSNYYSYQKRNQDNVVDPAHEEMLEWIRSAAEYSDNTYGARRMQKVLNALIFSVSRRKSAQLVKGANVRVHCEKKYKATTNSKHKKPIYKNKRQQNFNLGKPNQEWVQGITHVGHQKVGYILLL